MGALGVGGGLQIGGDILGMLTGANQQNKNNQAVSQLTGGLNSILGTEGGAVNQLLGNYTGWTMPQLQSLVGSLSQQAPGLMQGGLGYMGQAGGMANQLGNMAFNSPALQGLGGVAGQLANFNGLTPQQIALLSTQAGNAASSAGRTMLEQAGNVANPALLAQQLQDQAGSTAQDTAVQLGSQAAGEKLSGLQGAAGAYGSLFGSQAGALQGAGSMLGSLGSNLAGLSQNDISSILSGLGQSGQALGWGMSGLGNMAGTYGNLLGATLGATQNSPNPFATGFGNIGSLISTAYPGGGGGKSSAPPGAIV